MSRPIDLYKQIFAFIRFGIWRITEQELSRTRRLLYRLVKTIILALRGFINERLNIRASALTYSILFAMIPIFALLIAIGKGFGVQKMIEGSLDGTFIGQSGMTPTVMGFVERYLQSTQKGIFIGVGLAILFWSVLNFFMQVENAFNSIWQVKKPRSVINKITTYFSTVLLLPVLIVFTGGFSIYVSSAVSETYIYQVLTPLLRFFVKLIPYAVNCLVFTFMYMAVPNTRVRFKHALVAGVVAGCAFQAFQMLYINGQVYLSRYNVVYGSFAAIPLLLLWLQISCLIVLLGAEISYVSQNLHFFEYELDSQNISPRYKSFLTLFVTYVMVKRFENQEKSLSAEAISREYLIPIRIVNQIVRLLVDISLITEVSNENSKEKIYMPAIDINVLTVGLLFSRMESFGAEDFLDHKNPLLDNFRQKAIELTQEIHQGKDVLIKDL